MPVHGSSLVRRTLLGLGAAIAIAGSSASVASADFSLARCGGEGVLGRGSSFQTSAIGAFSTKFKDPAPVGCGADAPALSWDPAGSGVGRVALGQKDAALNPTQDRDPSVRIAGTDQAPSATERQQIEQGSIDANGANVTTADDDKVHVVPIAIGAIAIAVNLPAGCNYSGAALTRNRPTMTDAALEGVFAGTITTWGGAISGLDGACAAAPIKRVVRRDSSGTSFALKQFLADINPAAGWGALGNTAWLNEATQPVVRADANGGGSLRAKLDATPGGIGYIDLATARSGGIFTWANSSDEEFWLPLQNRNSGTYEDPQLDATGYQNTTTHGANCNSATPKTALPADSFGDWSKVDYTDTATGYPACTLTYDLVFDDDAVVYCTSAAEERKARFIKDFLGMVVSAPGQGVLPSADYDVLPTDALARATAAVNAIGWNKNGAGRPCTVAPPAPTPTPTPTPTPGGGTTPPPAAPSNVFTLASARVTTSTSTVRLSLQLPGAGAVVVSATAKPKKGASVKLSAKTFAVTGAGAKTISVTLSAKAKKALKKAKSLSVKLTIVYTPKGGTARTVTKTVTVKAPAAKKKSKK